MTRTGIVVLELRIPWPFSQSTDIGIYRIVTGGEDSPSRTGIAVQRRLEVGRRRTLWTMQRKAAEGVSSWLGA